MRCPRHSRKKSKTRCFNNHDVVVTRTSGRCPNGSRKTSKNRCFNDNDNELIFTPNSPYVPERPPSPPGLPPSIHTIPPYMLNHIQRFVGPETTRGYMNPQTLAMLPQIVPSLGRMMFDFLYIGNKPKINKNTISYNNLRRMGLDIVTYREMMFTLFKEHVRNSYLIHKIHPIPLTPHEEQIYKYKLDTLIAFYGMGVPNRAETLLYLEDTTGVVSPPSVIFFN